MKKWKEFGKKISTREAAIQGQGSQGAFSLLRGMAIAYAITCIIFIAYSFILTYTNLSETTLPTVSLVATALSAAIAGYDWAVCMGKKGLLYGIMAGLVYTILLVFVTGLAGNGFDMALSKIMTLVVAMAGGAIGGIVGVNANR